MKKLSSKILPCILEALGQKEKLAENNEILRLEVQAMVQNETNTDLSDFPNGFDRAIRLGKRMGILRIKNDCIRIPIKINSYVQRKNRKALRLAQHDETRSQPTASARKRKHSQRSEQSATSLRNRSRNRSSVRFQERGKNGSHTGQTKDENAFQAVEVATPNHIRSLANLKEKTPHPISAPIENTINDNESMSTEFVNPSSISRSRVRFDDCGTGGSRSALTKDENLFKAADEANKIRSLSNLDQDTPLSISAPIQESINEENESLSTEFVDPPSISRSHSSVAKCSIRKRGRGRGRGAPGRRGRSSRGGRRK